MIKVVVINGRPECGKTTFELKCRELVNASSTFWVDENKRMVVDIISTVDFVKQIAKECGWNGVKTPENRKFLSDLKDLLTRWNDVPYQKIVDHIEYMNEFGRQYDWILFVDCREPAEIQKLKERLNATTDSTPLPCLCGAWATKLMKHLIMLTPMFLIMSMTIPLKTMAI